ncbi:hypothetical protein BC829DRAFT_278715 [Chytridium lagenaria]|nr:hypothetical protein BC829DRAFT_278715 [Chytridium lagenaria]
MTWLLVYVAQCSHHRHCIPRTTSPSWACSHHPSISPGSILPASPRPNSKKKEFTNAFVVSQLKNNPSFSLLSMKMRSSECVVYFHSPTTNQQPNRNQTAPEQVLNFKTFFGVFLVSYCRRFDVLTEAFFNAGADFNTSCLSNSKLVKG